MSKIKKALAVLMAAVMTLAMCTTAFAAAEDPTPAATKPVATDKATATVSNVEATATVTAYQVVKADYNSAGFTGYSAVNGLTIANPLAPTSDEITDIAKGDKTSLKSVTMTTEATEGLASFTAELEAGYWMVLVTGDVEEVYNPMLVGVAYSKSGSDNTMTAEPVDANSNWTLVTDGAYAKSTAPSINKEIVDADTKTDLAIGDTVDFKITTAIPSYSKEYTEVKVTISDKLSAGLTLQDTISVNGIPETAYSLVATNDGFTMTIDSEYALSHGTEEIIITYSAVLNDNAAVNFDPNTNTAKLEYSNDPGNSSTTKTTDDTTYNYTFAIGGKLNGSSTEAWNKVTQEILKGEMVKETIEGEEKEVFSALAGAEFKLTNTATNKEYTATSGTDGSLAFTGLDAGTYELVETKAPEGYSLSTKKTPVVISATYDEEGRLESYTITIDGTATSTYTATYEGTGTSSTITNIVEGEGNATTQVLNTQISALPSTGGIGTTIFTIGGVLIMLIAAGLYFASRRKAAK